MARSGLVPASEAAIPRYAAWQLTIPKEHVLITRKYGAQPRRAESIVAGVVATLAGLA